MSKNVLFRRFLRNPVQVGALCPSSRGLCRMMVSHVGMESAGVIVELGPGTGVITREIVRKMPENAKFIAIELDGALCNLLRQQFPEITVCNDSAAGIGEILKRYSLPNPNVVISGLPWANFTPKLQRSILCSVAEHIAPGGYFATFAYLQGLMFPTGQRFRKLLGEVFSEVETSPVIWKNLPPAFVYRCRK
ncbi:rRNA adenine N-6-methyltransferase family protein [uncultured Victivallis sp.]|uniref:class I SAM-dependent methyltransferase n=1 Tax=uncultured Victivallis sp. TaxID=354118 RepID=UPI0025D53AED|nr:rRNA adenine N-6-methyltransferase family protein [uncultured Victivallis sp.]